MAVSSYLLWILLLFCVFQTSANSRVSSFVGRTEHSDVAQILSGIPINLPQGIDPRNVNVTTITIKTCTGIEEHLALLKQQLEQKTLRNSQLNDETFELRSEVRLLRVQLATCSSTASAITGSYQTQLQNKMKQLLGTFDSDAFQILKIIALTREVQALQKKLTHATNSTINTVEKRVLQRELQEKINELDLKKQQIERSNINSALIFQIISLQNQVWDLEQPKPGRGDVDALRPTKGIKGYTSSSLEEQLDSKISQLRGTDDNISAVLQMLSLHSKITAIQTLISVHIEESSTNAADFQRQWRQKIELLKRKILQLSRDEGNATLTKEILKLQSEVDVLRLLIINAKKTTDSKIRELRVTLEQEKKKLENLQKQLEEADYAQAQLITKIITMMKDLRELQADQTDQTTTTTTTTTTLQTLIQIKEREFAKAQAEINELKQKLQLMTKECSGLEERYEHFNNLFGRKIVELSKAGDPKAALVLNVINLHEEQRTLREQISTTDDPDTIAKLQHDLEEKQEELHSKTADLQRLMENPRIILRVIELQNEIWDLERKTNGDTNGDRVKELQNRLDGLITELDDKSDENTKLVLKMISLRSQIEQLQTQLSRPQTSETANVTQLRHDLTTLRKELQKSVNELNEKNEANGRLILTTIDLHNQLRNVEKERHSKDTASSVITQLREQLKVKNEEHSRDQAELRALQTQLHTKEREHTLAQAEIRELQKKLQSQTKECAAVEERYEKAQTEFEQKIAQLNRTGDFESALVLKLINLHDELRALKESISTTDDPGRISELQQQLNEKQEELNSKTADLEKIFKDHNTILKVIELQNELRGLEKKSANETDADRVKDLQRILDGFIREIEDESDGNTKLILKIMTLQSQAERLQSQLSDLKMSQSDEATQLRRDLATLKKELQVYVFELNEKNQTNARLIMEVTDLHNKLRNLEKEKQNEDQVTSATTAKLREQLREKVEEQTRDRAEIEALQNQLIQMDAQCSGFEQKLKDLQNNLDDKITELQAKSNTVTSLTLQISTLTLQIEELKRQLRNTESETKIKELQKVIDKKTAELDKKTEELKERSAQPQRLLQIIAIQTEIERLVTVAANETDYAKIKAKQDHMNSLIDGIQDEDNENTQLMFKIVTQQEEITRLKNQEEKQGKAEREKIAELENELEDVRNQIKEKTLLLDSSDVRISNLSTQIMNLHRKIKPLEDEISDLKEANSENQEELRRRLNLSKKQLQDSERRLSEADAKNFNLIMQITDLRGNLKKAQKQATKAAKHNVTELEEQIQTLQRQNRKLENTNKELTQEVQDLKMCCSDANTQCDDLQRQLQQSQDDADRLQQQLHEKDADLKQLQQELEEQDRKNNILQNENNKLVRQHNDTQDLTDNLLKQLVDKDAAVRQLQQELEEQTKENNKLQDNYNNLQNKKNKLENDLQDLRDQIADVEDKTIHTKRLTLDPDTANPRIVLSADDTEMSTTAQIQDVPDYPSRFDVVLAVLGREGFSRGRNYWEVSVANKNCFHLGMASESVQRKGSIRFTPANGFWTIVLNKQGQYRAIDNKPSVIPIRTQPQTLGVLLDYKKGQISFYDAGARSHMYTFVGQRFTDKIHPFINFCVEDAENPTSIVLLTPGSVDWII